MTIRDLFRNSISSLNKVDYIFPYLAFTRVSLDILANMSAVSINSMDCLSKIVDMACK